MPQMALHGEVAPAGGDVVRAGADQFHGPVGGLREDLQIVRLVHVTVVVGPAPRHLPRDRDRQRAVPGSGLGPGIRQAPFMGGDRPAGAVIVALQGAQDGDQVVVPDALQAPHVVRPGLPVGLLGDPVDQVAGQLRDVGQPAPAPLQRRPELRDEVPHAGFAAGDPVGLEQTHLRPAQAEAAADRFVDLGRGGDAVPHQPQRFAPRRFQQPVGDVRVDLLADRQRPHADRLQERDGAVADRRVGRRRRHHLHQRQEIDRIERVADQYLPRTPRAALQVRWLESRRGRGEHGALRRMPLDLAQDGALRLQPFGHAFLYPVGVGDRRGDRIAPGQRAFGRQGAVVQGGQAAPGVVQDRAHLPPGVGARIEHRRVPAVEQEPRGPAAADHAAADDGGSHRRGRLVSCSRSRTRSGPITVAPIASMIVTARSTSCALVAGTPLRR